MLVYVFDFDKVFICQLNQESLLTKWHCPSQGASSQFISSVFIACVHHVTYTWRIR